MLVYFMLIKKHCKSQIYQVLQITFEVDKLVPHYDLFDYGVLSLWMSTTAVINPIIVLCVKDEFQQNLKIWFINSN